MKILKLNYFSIISGLLLILSSACVDAQQADSNWEFILVREDNVKPYAVSDYEVGLADMKFFLEENKIDNFSYFTHLRDDYTFMHFTEINSLGDLEHGVFDHVKRKINNQEFDLIWNNVTESLYSYKYYLIKYSHELSYIPEMDDWQNGRQYRKWSYYYFKPGSEKEVETILASWRQLYNKLEVKNGYRIFAGSIGTAQPLYIFSLWAEGPKELIIDLEDNMALLGDEGVALWAKTFEYVERIETYEGWYLPQYSYTLDQKLADPK